MCVCEISRKSSVNPNFFKRPGSSRLKVPSGHWAQLPQERDGNEARGSNVCPGGLDTAPTGRRPDLSVGEPVGGGCG